MEVDVMSHARQERPYGVWSDTRTYEVMRRAGVPMSLRGTPTELNKSGVHLMDVPEWAYQAATVLAATAYARDVNALGIDRNSTAGEDWLVDLLSRGEDDPQLQAELAAAALARRR